MKQILELLGNERGAAAIEFALILPILMALLGGIFEYGRILFVEQAVRDLIDEAVRRGVITDLSAADVKGEVYAEVAVVPGIGNYTVAVTDGDDLAVTVVGSFNLVLGEFLPQDMLTFSMTGQFPR